MRLADMEARNAMLQSELEKLGGRLGMTVFRSPPPSSPAADQFHNSPAPNPITFSQELSISQELFSSRDGDSRSVGTQPIKQEPTPRTVNPASLSPEMRPVESSNASSSDMTQHPAVMLCDLQCQSGEQRPWMPSTATASISQAWTMMLLISLTSTAISTILSPLSRILLSLRTGSSLPSTPSILTLIIWITTTPASLTTSSSTTTSKTTTSLRPRFSLRIRLLRRLLACSPNLARPLKDATMVAMRSASEQQLSTDCLTRADVNRDGRDSPSMEVLMTLLWAITVIEKERGQQAPELDAASGVGRSRVELEDLFRPRHLRLFSSVGGGVGGTSSRQTRKSRDRRRRMAFK